MLKISINNKQAEVNLLYRCLIQNNGILSNETKAFYEVQLRDYKLNLIIRKKPSSDLDAFYQVFSERDYQDVINKYKSNFFSSNVRIFDAGANVGYTSAFFFSAFQKVSIVSIEPDDENYSLLARNIELNSINARLIKGGIWGKNTYLKIVRDFRDRSDWAIRVEEANDSKDLKAWTINDILTQVEWDNIDILKVDIEGSEKQVFCSNNDLSFLKQTKCIAIEIHDEFNCRSDIYQVLKENHFELTQSGGTTIGINKEIMTII